MPRLSLPLVAFLATVLVRGLVAASRLDELELELYTGSFAWALLTGLPLDPEKLPIIAHLRGSVVFGVLVAPLYALFGATLGVLKVFAVLWSGLGAALFALVLQRAGGRRAAWIGLILFALAPPAQQMVEVLALGSHADTLPFILAPLALLLKGEPGQPLPARRSVVLGLWLGAGCLFSLQTCVAYIALLPVWFYVDPRAWRSASALWTLLGTLPGLALIPVISREAKLVNRGYGDWFQAHEPVAKFARAFGSELRDAWLFADRGVAWAGWILYAAVVIGLAVAVVRLPWRALARSGPAPSRAALLGLFAVVHVAALLAAYSVLDFHVNMGATLDGMGSRYFMPLLPALLAPLSLGLAVLLGRGGAPRIAGGLGVAALLAASAAGLGTLIDLDAPGREPPVRGTEFHEFRTHIAHASGPDRTLRVDWIERVSPDWPELWPLVYTSTFNPRDPTFVHTNLLPGTAIRSEIDAIRADDPRARDVGFSALGEVLGKQWADEGLARPGSPVMAHMSERLAWTTRLLADREARWFARGFGRSASVQQARFDLNYNRPGKPETRPEAIAEGFLILDLVPPHLREPVAEGMGSIWGLRASPYKRLCHRMLAGAWRSLPARDVEAWFRGYGWGYRYRFAHASYRVPDPGAVEAMMRDEARAAFRAGLAPDSAPDGGQAADVSSTLPGR